MAQSDDEKQAVEAFIAIARELGVRVVQPFTVNLKGQAVEFDAHFPDFGSPNGMVALWSRPGDEAWESIEFLSSAARSVRMFLSVLNSEGDCPRQCVIDTFDDWQYFGPAESKPAWYTGKPWT